MVGSSAKITPESSYKSSPGNLFRMNEISVIPRDCLKDSISYLLLN